MCDQSASCNKSTSFKYPHLLSLQPIYSGQYANITSSCHFHGRWPVQQCQQEVQPSHLFHPKASKSENLSLSLASLFCERRKGYAQRVPSFSWIRLPTNIVHVFSLWNRSLRSENRWWDPRTTWPLHNLISFIKEKLTIRLVPFCRLVTPQQTDILPPNPTHTSHTESCLSACLPPTNLCIHLPTKQHWVNRSLLWSKKKESDWMGWVSRRRGPGGGGVLMNRLP